MFPGGCLPLPRGCIHVYGHNIQTISSLKLLCQIANQSQTLCGASLGRENENLYKWSILQDGHHGYKKQKLKKIFFSRTRRPMILKLGIKFV